MSDTRLEIANTDLKILIAKNAEYGESWKKRGGIGAFMMLARKWDRLETQCERHGYDIFKACEDRSTVEDLLDTIGDLRRYLLLVEEHVTAPIPREYVNPDL